MGKGARQKLADALEDGSLDAAIVKASEAESLKPVATTDGTITVATPAEVSSSGRDLDELRKGARHKLAKALEDGSLEVAFGVSTEPAAEIANASEGGSIVKALAVSDDSLTSVPPTQMLASVGDL